MEYLCNNCPRMCNVMRAETGSGVCRMGADAVVARAAPHFDEEPVVSGTRGSGAVFFSGCSLRCRFCQNYGISHGGFGRRVSVDLALRPALAGGLAGVGVVQQQAQGGAVQLPKVDEVAGSGHAKIPGARSGGPERGFIGQ